MPVSRFSRPCLFTRDFSPPVGAIRVQGKLLHLSHAVKFTYGPTKNLEMYVIAPFINNFCNRLDASIAGPNGERSASYGGIGDITAVPSTCCWKKPDAGCGHGSGRGRLSHRPRPPPQSGAPGQDAIGTGAFTFTTGVNLYKWLKPFLIYSNIWLNTPVNLYPSKDDAVRSREFVTFNLAAEYLSIRNGCLNGNVQQLDLDQHLYPPGVPVPSTFWDSFRD